MKDGKPVKVLASIEVNSRFLGGVFDAAADVMNIGGRN